MNEYVVCRQRIGGAVSQWDPKSQKPQTSFLSSSVKDTPCDILCWESLLTTQAPKYDETYGKTKLWGTEHWFVAAWTFLTLTLGRGDMGTAQRVLQGEELFRAAWYTCQNWLNKLYLSEPASQKNMKGKTGRSILSDWDNGDLGRDRKVSEVSQKPQRCLVVG